MKKLLKEPFNKAKDFITKNARPLEQKLFNYYFENGTKDEVYNELKHYQNADGGFGHGLEPDFLLSDSSPMATTIAFQILSDLGASKDNEIIKRGINYFITTFNQESMIWLATTEQVNNYPHAPWWSVDCNMDRQNQINEYFPNPTPEIIGYLHEYRELFTQKQLDLNALVDISLKRLSENFESLEMHGMFCYQRLGERVPTPYRTKIKQQLKRYLDKHLETTIEGWKEYKPSPLMFVKSKSTLSYDLINHSVIDEHINYIIDCQSEDGTWIPTWPKELYENDHYDIAWPAWQGILTLNYLKLLKEFDRIEGLNSN